MYEILERSKASDRLGRFVDYFLMVLIVTNVMAAILETVPSIAARRFAFFWWFEVVSVAIFTVEYGLRLWTAVEASDAEGRPWRVRVRYALTWGALIDLFAILPFYLAMFFNMDLRVLRVFRLLRLLKLSRYSAAFSLLTEVMRREASTLFVCSAILFVLLIVTASGAYLVERVAQPEDFGSIPAAMWWAMATLTTVGYGDVTPVTVMGKIFGGVVTAIGIGMAALPAGILASGLSSELAARRAAMRSEYLSAMTDGRLHPSEAASLEVLRKDLGLSREEAAEAEEKARLILAAERVCPHCGGALSAHLV